MPHGIVLLGNPVLRKRAERVPVKDIESKNIASLINKMTEILSQTEDGIGIAAPQIGEPLRIFIASEEALVIDKGTVDEKTKKKNWRYFVFINPEVIKLSGKKVRATEGCLSIPKKYGVVPRAEKIRVRAYDEHGKKFERGASQLFARLIQHEIDHLEGILYIDRAEKIIETK